PAVAGCAAAACAARRAVRSLVTYVVEAAAEPAPQISLRENLVTALLASLVIVGLYVDGWRHINLADNRAGAFLTWWHVPLYIGAPVTGLWITARPLRAAWAGAGPVAPGFRRFFPVLLSLTLCTAAISFIVQFLLPFLLWTAPVPDIAALGDAGENTRIVGLASVLTANLLLMAP